MRCYVRLEHSHHCQSGNSGKSEHRSKQILVAVKAIGSLRHYATVPADVEKTVAKLSRESRYDLNVRFAALQEAQAADAKGTKRSGRA